MRCVPGILMHQAERNTRWKKEGEKICNCQLRVEHVQQAPIHFPPLAQQNLRRALGRRRLLSYELKSEGGEGGLSTLVYCEI